MPLFSAKLDYALRAVIDLAMQSTAESCQSREIAARQDIRGPYLDQILAVLKREGIVRSTRGAGGGYALARPAAKISVGDVVRAVVGAPFLYSEEEKTLDPLDPTAYYVVHQLARRADEQVAAVLDGTTIADLVSQKQRLDDSMSFMPGI